MNAKVEEFINKMKEEQKLKELKQKEEHLISLGLLDESKSTIKIEYRDYWESGFDKWDEEKGKYYKETKVLIPIDVSDEEYQEILRYAPIVEKKQEKEEEDKVTSWAKTIKIFADILFVLNIIAGLILCFAMDSDYVWIPIVAALSYCIFYYPIIAGFSKIVAVAEKNL